MKHSETILFCDGACSGNPGPGGWGTLVLSQDSIVTELGGGASQTTNNQMEMTSVIRGLEFIKNFEGKVRIFTDSTYVIRGITQWIHGWHKRGWISSEGKPIANKDLWQQLYLVVSKRGREHPIEWRYVRGHTGVAGNERVDEVAVAFSKNLSPSLYQGPLEQYHVALFPLPKETPLPKDSDPKPKASFTYLSLIGTSLARHSTWAECERRVKGQSGAKYKKVQSAEEEEATLRAWGVKL